MSKYNESIKSILTDVESFLIETLKSVSLSKNALTHKDSILQKINTLRAEYPSVLPPKSANQDDDSSTTFSSADSHDGESAYNDVSLIPSISAAEVVNGAVRSGFLSKRRKTSEFILKFTPYQKRWCVIRNNVFYYYEKPTDKGQKGAFSLTGYEFREAPFQVKEASKKDLSFQLLRLGDRTYEFLANNKNDMLEWKAVVEKTAKEALQDSPTSIEYNEEDDEDIYQPIDEPSCPAPPPASDDFYDDGTHIDFRPSSVYADAESFSVSTPVKPAEKLPPREPRPPPPEIKQTVPDSSSWKLGIANDYGNMYYGKWDCSADTDNELAFKQGDIIHVLSREFESRLWWVAELQGKIGLVPKQYLSEAYEKVIS